MEEMTVMHLGLFFLRQKLGAEWSIGLLEILGYCTPSPTPCSKPGRGQHPVSDPLHPPQSAFAIPDIICHSCSFLLLHLLYTLERGNPGPSPL